MSEHSILAPSAADRWGPCPGSVTMERRYPEDEEDPATREGTAVHWACAEMLEGRPMDVGVIAPNGVVLDTEMMEAADLYVEEIQVHKGLELHIEERVECREVHEECWGTPDAWAHDAGRRTLYLWDFKYGHRFVEAFQNWQFIVYLAGILRKLGVDGLQDQTLTIIAKVVQPRNYHPDGPVRAWRLLAADLRPLINLAAASATRALGKDPETHVGPHCRDCRARHACPTLAAAGWAACDVAGKSIPVDLPPAATGLELTMLRRAASMLDARITGLEEATLGALKRGTAVPGWTYAQGVGRERWAKPLPEILALGEMMGVSVSKPGAITPKQAIKAGIPAALVAGYAETPKGEIKLLQDNGSIARRIFGGNNA